jgi:subtilisin-like proprotein convertase family protein
MKSWRPLTWLLLSAACFLGAFYFWRLGDRQAAARRTTAPGAPASTTNRVTRPASAAREIVKSAGAAPVGVLSRAAGTNAAGGGRAPRDRFKYRLSNTTRTAGQLARSGSAILLQNALIDTSRPLDFSIPDNLRAKGDPGTYIVQARGPLDNVFRAALKAAGLETVSYIPNDACLVRGPAGAAQALAGGPAQAVIPFEPYYKLSPELLALAVEQQPLPADTMLNLVVYADSLEPTVEALRQLGVPVLRQSGSPFGPVLTVQPGSDSLPAIAGLPGVGPVERVHPRWIANDLSRARVGVAADTITAANYLGLSGLNVVVAVNDSGVDATHPDLNGRVVSAFAEGLVDTNGHGTHVAGTIAGNGTKSTTVTNASGSIMPGVDGQFRGMAPAAELYSQPILFSSVVNYLTDYELQEAAAQTNALISNNSWNFGDSDYDIEAASYDAAVRDALPEVTGSQPVTFVFSAGNAGDGQDDGTGVTPGSILSPATAKNVITVGALEQPRNITNEVVIQGQTNTYWALGTDSDYEVASFSSRGNVGINIEGDFGRFKPDVVAPGVFLVSTRSQQWDKNAYYNPTNVHINTFLDEVAPNTVQGYLISLPYNVVGSLSIQVFSIYQGLNLPIYVAFTGGFPDTNDYDLLGTNQLVIPVPAGPTNWFYAIGDPTNVTAQYEVVTTYLTTNDYGDELTVLSNMNETIGDPGPNGPWYRYETGTSMSAANVSGVLALIGDFFTNRLQAVPSPALLKAMLINGARNTIYDFQVNKTLNDEGWGVVDLTNSIPSTLPTNSPAAIWTALTNGPSPMLLFDQSPDTALATGDSRTVQVHIDPSAQGDPLRVTLVWTDPPGNPAAGIKLVNDLDLVVTNESTGDIYWGNDIPAGSTVNFSWDTNTVPNRDVVNNVENVYLDSAAGDTFSVTVIGHFVNVNAVTAQSNNVVQDYALVISSGDGGVANALSTTNIAFTLSSNLPLVTIITNEFVSVTNTVGQLLLNQRLGANSPLIGDNTVPLGVNTMWGPNGAITLGVTNQWHFYLLTNSCDPTFTNAAFAIFLPVNLAPSRMGVTNELYPDNATRVDPDLDLYVSTNSDLTNLVPSVISSADKSLGRGGTEVIVYSNAVPCQTYYVGVKSEDQQAAEYGFFGVFSQLPFSDDVNGVQTVRGINVPQVIPYGSPTAPQAGIVMGIAVYPTSVRHVVVTNVITDQRFGDLFGSLTHARVSVVLNNHGLGVASGEEGFVYEDGGEIATGQTTIGGIPYTVVRSDGPGSLTDFMGTTGVGLWMLTEVNNASGHTGQVDSVSIRLDPQATGANNVELTIAPLSWVYDFVDVPPQATNLTIIVRNDSSTPLPLFLYVRRGDLPTQTEYDFTQTLGPGGGTLTINGSTQPPLLPGRYYIGIYNPNMVAQTVNLKWILELSAAPIQTVNFTSAGAVPLLDDAVSYSTITLTNIPKNVEIADVSIGAAILHPRVSDLVLTLISPQGQRQLLMENRGGPNAANLGTVTITTNFFPTTSSGEGSNAISTTYGPIPTNGTILIDYNYLAEPDSIDVYYDGVDIFSRANVSFTGQFVIPYGPGASTNLTIVMNQNGNPSATTLWTNTVFVISQSFSYLTFTDDTNLASVPIKFAIPPFVGGVAHAGGVVMSDGFEGTPRTLGLTGYVDGWQIDSGNVDVITTGQDAVIADTGTNALDLNGTTAGQISTNFNTAPGDYYVLSFAYTRNPNSGDSNFTAQATVSLTGQPDFQIVYGPFNSVTNMNWSYTSVVFRATATITTLEFTSLNAGNSGMYLDTVQVAELPTAYFPEEPLEPLIGGNPEGAWTLEVRDDRVGATNSVPPPELVSWQLQFILATNTVQATPLVHCVPVTGTVGPCQVTSFYVDAPDWVTVVTNELISASGPVNLWYSTNGIPSGSNSVSNFELLANTINGTNTVSTTDIGPRRLFPGQRYYLGVQNTSCAGGSNVTFVIHVAYNNITPVPPGVPVCGVSTNFDVIYFSYDVSTNATAVMFQLTNIVGGNLDLIAKRGAPLPTLFNYDYGSFNPGTSDEEIIVFTNSTPVALAPGRWYLGVVNVDEVPSSYCLVISEYTNPLPSTIVTLTSGIPYFNTNSGAGDATDYYEYDVSGSAARVQFEINNPDNDVILVARKGLPPPTLALYDYISANGCTNDELIVVLTNSTPVPLTPGDWFISAVNVSGGPASYSIMATEWPTTGRPIDITGGQIINDSGVNYFSVTWDSLPGVHYYVQGVTDLNSAGWTTISPTVTATDYTTTWLVQLPSPYQFFRVGEGLVLSTCVPTLIPPPGTTITNVIPQCQFRYYTVAVPPVAAFATNFLVSASAPVNVWFNPTNFPSGTTNAGDVELITNATTGSFVLSTNGTPPLVPGSTYYLGVENPCSNGGDVLVAFRLDFGLNIITLTNGIPFFNVNLGGNNGTNYYRYAVSTNAARVQFEIDNPSGGLTLVARKGQPLPTPALFDYISANAYTNDELIVVLTNSTPVPLTPGDWYIAAVNVSSGAVSYSIKATEWPATGLPIHLAGGQIITVSGTNYFAVTWDSLPGVHYFVQGVTNLNNPNWTTISPTVTATDYTTTWLVQLPSPYHFFRVVEGLVLSTYVPPVSLGDGTTVTAAAAPCQFMYYTVDVPSLATFATNTIVSASAPVNLWFNQATFPTGTNAGDVELLAGAAAGSSFTLSTGGTPPLFAGARYYLGVENPCANGTNTVAIRLDLWPTTGLPISVTDAFMSGTNSFCFTWTSSPGDQYCVEGIADLGSTNWVIVAADIVATDTSTTWCIPLVWPYHFFRVLEGVGPPASPTVTVTWAGGQITLLWAGPALAQYQVERTPTLSPPAWNPVAGAITFNNGLFSFSETNSQPAGFYRVELLP